MIGSISHLKNAIANGHIGAASLAPNKGEFTLGFGANRYNDRFVGVGSLAYRHRIGDQVFAFANGDLGIVKSAKGVEKYGAVSAGLRVVW